MSIQSCTFFLCVYKRDLCFIKVCNRSVSGANRQKVIFFCLVKFKIFFGDRIAGY